MRRRWWVRGPVQVLRRVLAPASLELAGELPRVRAELAGLASDNDRLRQELGELREELARVEGRAGLVEGRADELAEGLGEARRLNLRIAELTDVVTELVLPLHLREIDPAVLDRLSPDTL